MIVPTREEVKRHQDRDPVRAAQGRSLWLRWLTPSSDPSVVSLSVPEPEENPDVIAHIWVPGEPDQVLLPGTTSRFLPILASTGLPPMREPRKRWVFVPGIIRPPRVSRSIHRLPTPEEAGDHASAYPVEGLESVNNQSPYARNQKWGWWRLEFPGGGHRMALLGENFLRRRLDPFPAEWVPGTGRFTKDVYAEIQEEISRATPFEEDGETPVVEDP